MEDKDLNLYARCEPVPYVVHESDMARMEKAMGAANKRYFIVVVLLILALLGSWVGFFIHESQMETVTETTQEVWQEADNNGVNRFTGGDYYGNEATRSDNDPDLSAEEGTEP